MTNVNSTQNSGVTIRKISKPNCVPCQVIGYALTNNAEEIAELGATIVEHDITVEPDIIDKYNVQGVPVLLFERNGHVMARIDGMTSIDEIMDAIEHAKRAK